MWQWPRCSVFWRHVTAFSEKEITLSETQTGAVSQEEKRKLSLVFMPARSDWVSVHIPKNYIRGQNVLWNLQNSTSNKQNDCPEQCFCGCSSFGVESVKIHESSTNHVRATAIVELNQRRLQSEMQIWSFEVTHDFITILSLILHSCLDDPNWNQASRPSGLLVWLTTQKKNGCGSLATSLSAISAFWKFASGS